MREVALPLVFQQFAPYVRYVQQHSATEWSSTCVSCGGEIHQDGSWPDRCRWWNDSHPRSWCRVCGKMFYPDQFPGYVPPTPEQQYKWTQERIAEEEAKKRSAERALAHLRSARLWEQYHDQMNIDALKYYEGRGFVKEWVDFFGFGWKDKFRFAHKQELYVRPSATIPFYGPDGQVQQIKNRIVWEDDAPKELQNDKYRPEVKGVGTPLYLCDYTDPLDGNVIVCEGEFKAAKAKATLGSVHDTVVGLPGINPDMSILDVLKDAKRIYLITDPDTREQTWKICKYLGKERCHVRICDEKLDDWIIKYHIDGNHLRGLIRQIPPVV